MKGKMTKLPFNGRFQPAQAAFEVVHGDLICPATNSGSCYFLTLIDQYTSFIHATLLHKKSGAMAAILEFKTKYEKQTGKQIKKIVTNGGGKFCNRELGNILKQEEIIHTVSPPYTPQHNGFA
jgi:transposase InsO family protein